MQISKIQNTYYPNYRSVNINFQGGKIIPTQQQWSELQVFMHHIYEYKKGLRNLILTTEKESNRNVIVNRLESEKKNIKKAAKEYGSNITDLDYYIQNISDEKINVFFGNPQSIAVIKSFNQPKLSEYTPEQDFILGTLLGYDKIQQCQRYLKFISNKKTQ